MRNTVSDEALAAAAQDGDGDAFALLLERHYDRIFRIAYRILGSRAEAEDLTQDLCLALGQKIGGFAGRAAFTTWLTSLVINAGRDRLRRLAARTKAGAGWAEAEGQRRAEAAEAQAASAWLQAAMAALTPELRETAALVVGEGMAQAEAATALGIAEGTVAWRMDKIKRTLRRLAEEEVA